ncbi:hypothetical protein KDL01_04655 [Actinospica durhamensis]|uniref:NHL repeat-containing protein n=1 Tax=Actinospica durhamensis TaxID=1508375 RepID=A0A941EH70_9ACTN|nr:hypothetical protein [Actinospica durhamensis]MBR7832535.1 hypothetical protein [Actinospica durhamensis]
MARQTKRRSALLAAASLAAVGFTASPALAMGAAPMAGGHPRVIASTVPANGDVNPYGVAIVPRSTGALYRGNILVSNFNNVKNLQGTGTTIVQVSPNGRVSTFARINPARLPGRCPGGVGLTTALVVLRSGWVVVGSLPTKDGTAATAKAGCLLVLDDRGRVRETIAGHGVNGPWDMTALDRGSTAELFVTNVLNGTVAAGGKTVYRGTVERLTLKVSDRRPPYLVEHRVIGSRFGERTDPAALVVGPTGVGLSREGTLYVADSVGNRITAIPNAPWRSTDAGTGRTVTAGGKLNTPLGLALDRHGRILTVNAGDGNLLVTSPRGRQLRTVTLDKSGNPPGAGALFGLAVEQCGGVYYVDDATNTLNLLP